jgi:two-component system sensor histidine kinase CpxA
MTAVIIVTTNVIVHWRGDSTLQQLRGGHEYEPAQRFLFQMAGALVNRNSAQVLADMRAMPDWSRQYFYIVDANNNDLLGRPLPASVQHLSAKINPSHPFSKVDGERQKTWGRQVTLNDGKSLKVFTLSSEQGIKSSGDIVWQLFINNIWPLLLASILASGTACFFLARHFAHGLSTLQKATHSIAKGDLSVRISQRFANRQDEIASLAHDFDHMTERLQKAMTEQKRLIKDVSHELRTPLARLQVALALAKQRSSGEVDRELARIQQAADYLNEMIDDILALPVLDDGTWTLDDTTDIVAMLHALHGNLLADAAQAGIILELNTPKHEVLLTTHGNMLYGVFDNITRNAIRYTPKGGRITTTLNSTPKTHQIHITDTGPGVPEEQLDDIFQPFYRTDQARGRDSGGYGLGLAIAQRTTALHGGHIKAHNIDGGGLCVTVTLPNTYPAPT